MLKLDEIRKKLQACNASEVARQTELHPHTVRAVARGETCSLKTYEALAKFLGAE